MKTLKEITEGKTVQIPVYDFVSHSRSNSHSCLAKPLLTAACSPATPASCPSCLCLLLGAHILTQNFNANISTLCVRGSRACTGAV